MSDERLNRDTLTQDDTLQARARALSRDIPPPPGYELERLLGAGTFGEVWLARDTRTGVRVAIKFFSHAVGPRWEYLQAEIQQLAALRSDPGIIRLIDLNPTASPPYYVMDYAEGGSLAHLLEKGPLPLPEALAIFRKVVQAMAYVHSRGIRHCDLKPANVLLTARGEPLLADFGQAQLRDDPSPALGTFFYMPAEQATLEPVIPDPRWDVYALGALLFHMLVGHAPYDRPEIRKRLRDAPSLAERLSCYRHWLRHSPPPREHYRVPGMDRVLARILDRCLEQDPKRRFPNAEALMKALEQWERWKARRPLVLLGGFVPTALACVILFFLWQGTVAGLREAQRLAMDNALRSNRLVAALAARAVGQEVDRRWRILEAVAADPIFRRLVEEAATLSRDQLPPPLLQQRLQELHENHRVTAQARSWFVTDRSGRQVARSPLQPETLGRDFSFRDYFHGQGTDLPEQHAQVAPIRRPHRSMVFVSQATGTAMIALSVPVFGQVRHEPVGVLAMTVEVGHFFGLREEANSPTERFLALFDCRPDWTGAVGLILQHPMLARRFRVPEGAPVARYGGDLVERVRREEAIAMEDFGDPLLGGRWVAAIQLVRPPRENIEVSWAVVSAESHGAALKPMDRLRSTLIARGLITTAALGVALVAVWGLLSRELRRP